MQIKRFEAKDMTTALRMIKAELGADAVILSARSKRKGKGFFGSLKYAGVEVSAAIDSQLPAATPKSPVRATRDPYRQYSGNRSERYRSMPPASRGRRTGLASGAVAPGGSGGVRKKSTPRERIKAMSTLYQQILHQEVDRSIASELIEEIKRIPASEEILDGGNLNAHIGSLLEEMGVTVLSDRIRHGKRKLVVLVGATGVGKTTTIAKLAAREVSRGRRNVGLVTVDNYSIAAIHQLETYARIIGIPLETASGAGELQKAVKQFKDRDIIFIDTPGINPRERGQIQDLSDCLAGLVDPQIHLVLSASTKEKDCIAITKALKDIDIHHLLFTKLDESSNFGNIINVLIHTRLPLSYLCSGRRVPKDIEAGSVQRIVDLLFEPDGQFGREPVAARVAAGEISTGTEETKSEAIPQFVANRNSDVYHRTNCKWAKRIKRANTIKFADAREAEAQNFLPCRSCQPNLEQGPRHSELNTEMMQSYGYR